jgi:hypothetical protein
MKLLRLVNTLIILLLIQNVNGQSFEKYYNKSWQPCKKDTAFYHAIFKKADTVYKLMAYTIKTGKLKKEGTYADTNFLKGIGFSNTYYESGRIEESTRYDSNGNRGVLQMSDDGRTSSYTAFDADGNIINDSDETEASFPGGTAAWNKYLLSHTNPDVAITNGAPSGRYQVRVSFLINKEGVVSDVRAVNDPGYGTAQEAVKIIKNAPAWVPATRNKMPLLDYRMQTITFIVTR